MPLARVSRIAYVSLHPARPETAGRNLLFTQSVGGRDKNLNGFVSQGMRRMGMAGTKPVIWRNVVILGVTPIAALILVPYYGMTVGFDVFEWMSFVVALMLTGFSITAGYHRLWSHRTYDAHPVVRLLFVLFGSAGLENSVLAWSSDHRRHHRHTDDNEKDPYSAKRGFWYSHIGWILREYNNPPRDFSNVRDLERDPILRWQDKHYLAIALAMNIALPFAIGWMHGKLWGVFLLAVLLRIVVNHHLTFLINSLAHFWGRQPYSDANTARDNALLAFFTYGEGYHNYHHQFQWDYRNGIRWWQFDPSKWLIRFLSLVGLAKNLRLSQREQVEKALLDRQLQMALSRAAARPDGEAVRAYIQKTYDNIVKGWNDWAEIKQHWMKAKRERMGRTWEEIELKMKKVDLKLRLKSEQSQWRILLSELP